MNETLPLREATPDDAAAVLRLHEQIDLAEVGEVTTTMAEVVADLANPDLHARVVDDPAGGLLGFAWVERPSTHQKVWGDIGVRPGYDFSLAEPLLDWLRAEAQERGAGLPLHTFADSRHAAKQALYEDVGGEVIRRFYRMVIEFSDGPPPVVPELPAGVTIRGVSGEADLRVMHEVIDTAFIDHFSHEQEPFDMWARETVYGGASDLSLWWLAFVDDEPAAGIYCIELPDSGYVDTLGTLRAARGKGLGRALLMTAFGEFYRRGHRKATLGVDATNPTGALGLYESVGMHAEREGWRYQLPNP